MTAGLARGGRHCAQRPGLRGERAAAGIEQLSARWREQRGQREWRIRPAHAGGRRERVPHSHAECARRIRRHQRRDHVGGHQVGKQRFSRRCLRVPAEQRHGRAQLLRRRRPSRCTGISTAPPWADPSARTRISSSPTTKASAIPQGKTQAAIVPTAAERTGDFSGLTDPATGQPVPLINEFTGQPFPGNQIPSSMQNPIALQAEKLYPLPNIGTNVFESTQIGSNNYDQGGFRLDHYFGDSDQLFARYSTSSLHQFDPLPIAGAGVPGFPVTDDIVTNSATASWVHLISPRDRADRSRVFLPQRVPGRTGDKSHAGQRPRVPIPADARVEPGRSLSDRERLRVAGQPDYRAAEHVSERLSRDLTRWP